MKSYKISLIALVFLIGYVTQAQAQQPIEIVTNKVLCLFSFLETTKGSMSVSQSYKELIDTTYGDDPAFLEWVHAYGQIYMSDSFEKQGLPPGRHGYKAVKDLLWLASSYAKDIDDYSDRIMGLLPHADHVQLISIMKAIEPYYDDLVWDTTQAQIERMESQLAQYGNEISELYSRISTFYGTTWDQSIPFRVLLYPIPLSQGNTTAIPKGNALICGFLADNEEDYIGRLGVIIHEMCHILYDEQEMEWKHELASYFLQDPSEYNNLAYTYINEGLATVLGNGWAYKQIHGELDTAEWYNDPYINGFAKSLYPLTEQYMDKGQQMDSMYIHQAIERFGATFPNSTQSIEALMTDINVYANIEDANVEDMVQKMLKYFSLRGLSFATPMDDRKGLDTYYEEGKTKVFILKNGHKEALSMIQDKFALSETLSATSSFLYSFEHKDSKSIVIIISIHQDGGEDKALDILAQQETITLDQVIIIK